MKSNWINKYLRLNEAKKIINFEYEALCEFRDNGIFKNNKKLLSFSAINKCWSDLKLANIPSHILEEKKQQGLELMRALKEMYDNKIEDINSMLVNEITRKRLFAISRYLEENKFSILGVEKFICSQHMCGFIDLILRKEVHGVGNRHVRKTNIVEIKCRNSLECYESDKLQLAFYCLIMGESPQGDILILDDQGNYKVYSIDNETKQLEVFWNFWKSIWNTILKTEISFVPIDIGAITKFKYRQKAAVIRESKGIKKKPYTSCWQSKPHVWIQNLFNKETKKNEQE